MSRLLTEKRLPLLNREIHSGNFTSAESGKAGDQLEGGKLNNFFKAPRTFKFPETYSIALSYCCLPMKLSHCPYSASWWDGKEHTFQ